MIVYLDERCLSSYSVEPVLTEWKRVVDARDGATRNVAIYLDRQAVASGSFLAKLGGLTTGKRRLYLALLFGDGTKCWRPGRSLGQACHVSSEPNPVVDSAFCEAYEAKVAAAHVLVIGDVSSSYGLLTSVLVRDLPLQANTRVVDCGVGLPDFHRLVNLWGYGLPSYDLASTVPPTDFETALYKQPGRFFRTGKISMNGRRRVFREAATNRLFYVDNLHYGTAAHLEVFDCNGDHLGIADLQGALDTSRKVNGRVIEY